MLDTTMWESQMTTSGLYDEHWLLAYEANIKGWLPNPRGKDYVKSDQNFGYLKSEGVFFYDEKLAALNTQGQLPMPRLPGLSSGYGNQSI
jgi:hypothetical protein